SSGFQLTVGFATVNALALNSGRLYIGGTFSKINGLALSGGLAGVSVANPTVNWNPLLSGTVNAMQVVGVLSMSAAISIQSAVQTLQTWQRSRPPRHWQLL